VLGYRNREAREEEGILQLPVHQKEEKEGTRTIVSFIDPQDALGATLIHYQFLVIVGEK